MLTDQQPAALELTDHPVSHDDRLKSYHRIVILTESHTNAQYAKTAIGLLKYRTYDIVAVLDTQHAGKNIQTALGHGGEIPVIGSLDEVVEPDALFIGISFAGGRLPTAMRSAIHSAVARGIDVVSGLHDFIGTDTDLNELASQTGAQLIDIRANHHRDVAQHAEFRRECLRIHTVGQDCSVGKMVTSIEIDRELKRRNLDSKFLATGQTGIMIAGEGVPIDCVVSDFVNGAAEQLVHQNEQHDFLLIEGQGCIVHPSFSGVTTGLLHGSAPHGLILCYEAERPATKNLDHVPLKSLADLKKLYETMASARFPCEVIGVGLNGRRLNKEQIEAEKEKVREELGLPVCDVFQDGAAVLADAVLELRERVLAWK
mgnify:CR=1 FL=1|jgi:uncharacterized NAD-dependent epimerase/dehydratase family protein